MEFVAPDTEGRKLERYKNDYTASANHYAEVRYGMHLSRRPSHVAYLRIYDAIKLRDFAAVQHAMNMRKDMKFVTDGVLVNYARLYDQYQVHGFP